MKHSREQLKAELMVQAEEAIDELLDWHDGSGEPTLTEVEDVVLKLRKQLGECMVGVVVQAQEEVRPPPGREKNLDLRALGRDSTSGFRDRRHPDMARRWRVSTSNAQSVTA